MIPKTKLQIQVDKLSKKLRALTAAQKRWADDTVFKHYYFRTQKKNTCLECGHSWKVTARIPMDKLLTETCPKCHKELECLPGKKRTQRNVQYFYTAEVLEEFQILRYYHISRSCKVGYQEQIYITEVAQHWINKNGKRTVRAVLHNPNSFLLYLDYRSGMEVRANKDNYYYNAVLSPGARYLPELKRNGFRGGCHGLNPAFFFEAILSNPRAETLLKAKQYKLLYELAGYEGPWKIKQAWPSIRICMRNGYIVKDAQTWMDHLKIMREFGMDLLNAKNVCPKNLDQEHQRLIRRQAIAEKKKRLEKLKSEIEAFNKTFRKMKARYFGIRLEAGRLCVVVLDDVNDYYKEGEELNHCVFSNRYFEKKDTLILSAREGSKPVATVELSLKEWRVLQCRGKSNTIPPHREKIERLVMDNIGLFKKRTREHINAA